MAGLYVHVPFRRTDAAYDESAYVINPSADVDAHATALGREIRSFAREYAEEDPISTIYVGGGRPSLLPLDTALSIVRPIVDVFDVSRIDEVTVEVDPGDATSAFLHGLNRMGVDRLSLNVLSFFPDDLDAADASHSAEDAVRAIRIARRAGFDDLSVDLLFGWPEQPFSNWKAVLRQAVEMNLPHLTIMEMPGTPSTNEAEDAQGHRLEFAMAFLQSEGYEQYELTHFARPNHRSHHQENYYAHGNYLGIGPSSESFWWPDRTSARARRWTNVSDADRYAELLENRFPPVASRQTIERRTLSQEYLLLRLRTKDGLSLSHLREQYGLNLEATKGAELDRLHEERLVDWEDDVVRLTNRGRLLADAITTRLLPSM